MNINYYKTNSHILVFFILYISLLTGFVFDENVTAGPMMDFDHALKQVKAFETNFINTLLNYDSLESSTRISPVFIIIIFILKKIFINIDLVRFILINILVLNQFLFYLCLKQVFKKFEIDKKILFLLSCILFISPSFRSNIIWPESATLGLLFFLTSLFYFLKFRKDKNILFIYYNIIFLAISSYIRPSFSLFVIPFFLNYLFIVKDVKIIFKIIILNLILAFPAFYYVFVLDVFFISVGGLNFNYFNKISIITSIFLFHIFPILFSKRFFINELNLKKDFINFIISILLTLIVFLNFDYNINLSGGGIFLHASNYILNNNLLFFLILPFAFFFSIKVVNLNIINNLYLFILLFFITPQYHIFHKYYDPLIIILSFTLFDFKINKNFFKKINISFLFLFYIIYYFINFVNYYIISF